MNNINKISILIFSGFFITFNCLGLSKNNDLLRAKTTLNQILSLYDSGHDHLLNNTCSNTPASVLAFKLFVATKDSAYFDWEF